ncbi:MAG: hypothetical protein ABI202_02660 [Candidatus Baltobacteraceae bacterium]
MKRVFGFVFVLAGASCAVAAGSPSASKTKPAASASESHATPAARNSAPVKLAPADEYFGPLKMSILGIRNEIRDLGLRYYYNHDIAKNIVGAAEMTEKSLVDWQHRYPSDSMLARHIYLLEHLYASIDDPTAAAKADYTAKWLLKGYPKTWYAKNLRMTLARDEANRKAMASATPEPSQDHETTPDGAPTVTAAPVLNLLPSPSAGSGLSVPTSVPSAAPTPAGSPTPAVSPTAAGSPTATGGGSAPPSPSPTSTARQGG